MRSGWAIATAWVMLAGCAKAVSGNGAAEGGAAPPPPPASACRPAGLGDAAVVTAWKPPAACQWKNVPAGERRLVRSEAELGAVLDCRGEAPGVDFEKSTLVVAGRMLSPATMGVDVLDDGQRVTFVSRFRTPCENERPPMPVPVTLAALVPAGARVFGEASCTQTVPCR